MRLRGIESECEGKASRIACTENRKTYTALNPKKDNVSKFHIDDAVIREGFRCDYLVLDETEKKAIFIELKGEDVKHALEQISRTERELSADLSEYRPQNHYYRVVCSRVSHPTVFGNEIKKWRRAHKGDLAVKAVKLEESLDRI